MDANSELVPHFTSTGSAYLACAAQSFAVSIGCFPKPALHISGDGKVVFSSQDYGEILRFEKDGNVYVRGELVADNYAVYDGFVAWLRSMHVPVPDMRGK